MPRKSLEGIPHLQNYLAVVHGKGPQLRAQNPIEDLTGPLSKSYRISLHDSSPPTGKRDSEGSSMRRLRNSAPSLAGPPCSLNPSGAGVQDKPNRRHN